MGPTAADGEIVFKCPARPLSSNVFANALTVTGAARKKSGDDDTTNPRECPVVSCAKGGILKRKEELVLPDEEEEEVKFDRCAGVDTNRKKQEFVETIFTRLAKESYKVRRIRRKKAKPTPLKKKAKGTKTTQLRSQYTRKEKIVPSTTAAHFKLFRKPPFKNVGVFRLCYEKLGETLEKLRIRKRKKSPSRRRTKKK